MSLVTRGLIVLVMGWPLFTPATARAQVVEISPMAGYRFGGDFFELITNQRVDADGAPAAGVAVNVPLHDGLQVEALFTHQEARITVPATGSRPASQWRIAVDHWMAGGLQEFGSSRARPFLTGLLGLTRYAADGDNEIRFTVSAGGGVKLFPARHLGVRFDGRVFATIVDAEGSALACSPGICLVAFDAHVVWQAEFTTGLTVVF
jgi:hypothetical protein